MEVRQLNLGCGYDYKEGSINLDRLSNLKVDVVADVEQWLPFKDQSFDFVLASHIVEHCFDRLKIIEEIWRVTKPLGLVKIIVPSYTYQGAFADPTHKSFWGQNTIGYFTPDHPCNYYTKARFNIIQNDFDGQCITWILERL